MGFRYCLDDRNMKVLAGKGQDFVNFLEGKMGDEDA
jgi:hypothetical protein